MLDNKGSLKNLLTMPIDSVAILGLFNFKINSLRKDLIKLRGLTSCLRRLKKIFHQTMFLFGDDIQKKIY